MMREIGVALLVALCCLNVSYADEKTFTIATEEYPPFIGAELPNNGWTMEVATAILEPQGYRVSLELVPWARAVELSKRGTYDGLYLAYFTEERTQWYVFSKPVGEVRTGFFKLKGRDISFDTLDELSSYKIGMTRGVAISPEFDAADFLQKDEAADDRVNIQKLLAGRVDLVAAPESVFLSLVQTTLPPDLQDKFEFMTPPLAVQNLHMAISKQSPDHEKKLQDFNAGLERIIADGTYDEILRSHGFDF